MNEVFLIGRVTERIEYKFMIEKNKSAKAKIGLELLDKAKIEIIAYNEIADYCLQSLKAGDVIIVNGKITTNNVEAISIEKYKSQEE